MGDPCHMAACSAGSDNAPALKTIKHVLRFAVLRYRAIAVAHCGCRRNLAPVVLTMLIALVARCGAVRFSVPISNRWCVPPPEHPAVALEVSQQHADSAQPPGRGCPLSLHSVRCTLHVASRTLCTDEKNRTSGGGSDGSLIAT